MTARNIGDYKTAWERLRRLQRSTLIMGIGGVGGIIWLAHLAKLANGFALAPRLFLIAVFGWMSAMTILIAQRWQFRCPRCGKRFMPSTKVETGAERFADSIAQRCRSCGIRVGDDPSASQSR